MAAAISLAKTWNGKLGNGILLQESRTACDCPYLLLTLGSSGVNRRVPVLLSSILYMPPAHDSPVKPELLALAAALACSRREAGCEDAHYRAWGPVK